MWPIWYNALPFRFVARMLNKGHAIAPETFPSVTIYFSHLEGFDDIIAATKSPAEMTVILNSFYVVCDAVVEAMDVYKVETVGDAYMASGAFLCKLLILIISDKFL